MSKTQDISCYTYVYFSINITRNICGLGIELTKERNVSEMALYN